MPYLVTTLKPHFSATGNYTDASGRAYDLEPDYQFAAATLKERQQLAFDALDTIVPALPRAEWERWVAEINALPESGGRVGPLPDGTVIEVDQVSIARLADAVNVLSRFVDDTGTIEGGLFSHEIIAAYNNRRKCS